MKAPLPHEQTSPSPSSGGEVRYVRTPLGQKIRALPSEAVTIDIGPAHRGMADMIRDVFPVNQFSKGTPDLPEESTTALSLEGDFLDRLLQQALEQEATDIHWQIRPDNASSFAFRREGRLMQQVNFGQTSPTHDRILAMGINQAAGTIRRRLHGEWHIFRYQCMPCYPSGTAVCFRWA